MLKPLQATQNAAFQITYILIFIFENIQCLYFSVRYAVTFVIFFTCKVGAALTGIGVALFEVRVARATPKVYKPPPLVMVNQQAILLRYCQ